MGLGNIGIPSMILIIVIALLIFGPKRLPEIGRAAGETLKEFKNITSDLMKNHEAEDDDKKE